MWLSWSCIPCISFQERTCLSIAKNALNDHLQLQHFRNHIKCLIWPVFPCSPLHPVCSLLPNVGLLQWAIFALELHIRLPETFSGLQHSEAFFVHFCFLLLSFHECWIRVVSESFSCSPVLPSLLSFTGTVCLLSPPCPSEPLTLLYSQHLPH